MSKLQRVLWVFSVLFLSALLLGFVVVRSAQQKDPFDTFRTVSADSVTEAASTGLGSVSTNGAFELEAGRSSGTMSPLEPWPHQNPLVVHFLDVGQADSILILLPNGETILIDAGDKSASESIKTFIRSLGIKELTWVIATHPHADHIGGMAFIIDSFEVKNISMPRTGHTTKTYENLLLSIKNKGLSITEARAGRTIIEEDDLRAYFVAPNSSQYDDINDWSAVLVLEYGDTSFIFTGDATAKSESEILAHFDNLPTGGVLKVGHHGSNTSTSKRFLEVIRPSHAVICVGADDTYGHPSKNVLGRLRSMGVEVFRTDQDGTTVFRSDGKTLRMETDSQE